MKKIILAIFLVGCGSDPSGMEKLCTPGESRDCTCPGGSPSSQACNEDGSGFDVCVCSSSNGTGSGGEETVSTSVSSVTSSSSTGGGGSAANTGGSTVESSSSTGTTCAPKTCEDYGFNCGETDDGCGDKIKCGTCDSTNSYNICGGNSAPNSDGSLNSDSKENVCNGGCTLVHAKDTEYCQWNEIDQPNFAYICSSNVVGANPPLEGCKHPPVFDWNIWCCFN